MSAEVETMAHVGKTPWHGNSKPAREESRYNFQSFMEDSGLDWELEKVNLVTWDHFEDVDNFVYGIRRVTDGRLIGTVGPNTHLLQNREAFKWFEPFLEAKEAELHTAGSLRQGSRIWILAKLNREPMTIAAGDEVEKFLLLSHAHDNSLTIRVGFTPIRVVCANTLASAHNDDASKLIRIRHSKNMHENLENIREVINTANAAFEATAEQYRLLVRKSINQSDLEKYIKRVLDIDEAEKTSTRSKNMIQEIIRYAETGKGNELASVRGTYWTAYNGVSEWLSYERGHTQDSRLNSLWFGPSAKMNKDALQIALAMAA